MYVYRQCSACQVVLDEVSEVLDRARLFPVQFADGCSKCGGVVLEYRVTEAEFCQRFGHRRGLVHTVYDHYDIECYTEGACSRCGLVIRNYNDWG